MQISSNTLSKECKKRGFVRCGKSYIRVVGDGVFQRVLLGFKERLHSSSPRYSRTHRYEPMTLIYLKSMYARYDGFDVSIDQSPGFPLNVPMLLDKRMAPFMGATEDQERMLNEGFDLLDLITTQQQIIEHLEPLTYSYSDGRQIYSTQLYDMYLYCEEFYKAEMAIEREFTQNFFSHISKCKRNPELFSEGMQQFLDHAELYYEKALLTYPVHYDAMKARLQSNYEINFIRLKELGILD